MESIKIFIRSSIFAVILIIMAALPINTIAGHHSDHLKPVKSYFWEGPVSSIIKEKLLADVEHVPIIRVVSKPSFEGEWVLSVLWDESAGSYILRLREMQENSWYEMYEKRKPKFKFKEYSAEISENTVSRLMYCWKLMLHDTHYVSKCFAGCGGDGITYYFSLMSGLTMLEGQTWSPSDETRTGFFVQIAEMLKDYVKSAEKLTNERISNIERLCDKLKAYNPELESEICDPESVVAAQTQLAILGHFVGRFGEMKGPMLERAIKSFEKEHGLEETGKLTNPLMELIREGILSLGMVNLKGAVKKSRFPAT